MCRRFNPFNWARRTIIIVTLAFFAIAAPSYLLGFSAFATTINPVNATLRIPAIKLSAPVTPAILSGNQLETPNQHVAAFTNGNKLFLYAHNTTAFKNLKDLSVGDQASYLKDDRIATYQITNIKILPTSKISMSELTADTDQPTLILMTCAGQKTNGAYPDRLIVTAEAL